MKLSPSEKESLIKLLLGLHDAIAAIEIEHGLRVGMGDQRVRIEYFHDAIRAFTSGEASNRLNIEWLAYDVSCLRYIQSMPLSAFKPHSQKLSSSTQLSKAGDGLLPAPKRPNREAKEKLAELYQQYAVLFTALLKPLADRNFMDQAEELNSEIETLYAIIAACENKREVAPLINNLDNATLRNVLGKLAKEGKPKLVAHSKQQIANRDKTLKTIDKAHMNYAMTQLGLYEGAKDLLKKMAGTGMNLVGNFVEASMKETQRGLGR